VWRQSHYLAMENERLFSLAWSFQNNCVHLLTPLLIVIPCLHGIIADNQERFK